MCGKGWSRRPEVPRHTCPQCGEAAWDVEPDLAKVIGERTEYRVVEVETDPSLVMTLGIVWPLNPANNARVRLSHRLKETYRHAVRDHGGKNGVGLIVRFEKSGTRWGLSMRAPSANEERKVRTDQCKRHQWAIKLIRQSDNTNALGDQMHCSCPLDPPCEVCQLAATYSLERRIRPQTSPHFWTLLQQAVMRDLGFAA